MISPSVFTRFSRGWKRWNALAYGFKTTPYSVKSATSLRSYEGIIVLTKDGEHIQAILGLDGCFPTCLCPLSITISWCCPLIITITVRFSHHFVWSISLSRFDRFSRLLKRLKALFNAFQTTPARPHSVSLCSISVIITIGHSPPPHSPCRASYMHSVVYLVRIG
ncbi:hypothetical protein EDD85DRAFT_808161 [Armillaria nabsnona]|nr:hypothetical protein EDD85DRAFT_808161 [Armillaria nabsnona]